VRLLDVVDEYTRECLVIRADRHIRSSDVIETLAEIMVARGVPESHPLRQRARVYGQGYLGLAPKSGS